MSELHLLEDRISPDLIILLSSYPRIHNKLFVAALDWGTARYRKTHYIRRGRFTSVPAVPSEYFADPARLKTIQFHYVEDLPLEKAAELSLDSRVRADETLIIVECDVNSYLGEQATANTLALLASFSRHSRRSIVSFPYCEDLLNIASLFTKHIFIVSNDGNLKNIQD
ncbi:hypothetical protein V3C99_001384 [Haemonchus contortus]|uniref:RNA methyltransferase n=2 Tax=Haemonchus contortus TaxID=6289 RepID=A0A7I4YEP4_HAECO|nr:unnamed protein product [Haemonchus contortus]